MTKFAKTLSSIALLSTTMLLGACGGAGAQSAGGGAPASSGGNTGGGGVGGGSTHSFVDPIVPKTYTGIGSAAQLKTSSAVPLPAGIDAYGNMVNRNQASTFYDANATTVRNSDITIGYDPRSAEFTLRYTDPEASQGTTMKFQDPLHRTAFGGLLEPQYGVDDFGADFGANNLPGVYYLQAGNAAGGTIYARGDKRLDFILQDNGGNADVTTLFYQRPGTTTKYVTFAGFVRNRYNAVIDPTTFIRKNSEIYDRGAFAFGELTDSDEIPTTGSGTYTGSMLASMVFDTLGDFDPSANSFFQWIAGTSTTKVDFAALTFTLDVRGTVGEPHFDKAINRNFAIAAGSIFTASGNGKLDYVKYGGFNGRFTSAAITGSNGTIVLDQTYLSGSSIDGAFFGPKADEVGGSMRIVGGVPDQRVDIVGTFTGAK